MKKYFFILTLLAVFSCKKEDSYDLHKYPGLPDATREGKHTLGCLINGKPWVANINVPSLTPKLYVTYDEYEANVSNRYHEFGLIADRSVVVDFQTGATSESDYFQLEIRPIHKSGVITSIKELETCWIKFNSDGGGSYKRYTLDSLAPFRFEITRLDTIKREVSGLFDFKLKRGNDTIHVSNGRFDTYYYPQ